MDVMIKSRSGKLTDEERSYLQRKIEKLDRYLEDIGSVRVEVARNHTRAGGDVHVVEATLMAEHGVVIRAEERDPVYNAAVDSLHDTLQRQLTRYKDRHYRRGKMRRGASDAERWRDENLQPEPPASNGPTLVKTKQFVYKPMDVEEAIEQMELLNHDFFVFTDARSNLVNVVYRRTDGNYGMIEQDAS
jgi:putative sigma-54 modulation protein